MINQPTNQKFTVAQIKTVHEALALLSSIGGQKSMQENQDRVWVFKNPGRTRLSLARTFKNIDTALSQFTAAENGLKVQCYEEQCKAGGEKAGKLIGEHLMKFSQELQKLLTEQIDIEVYPVSIEDIDLNKNDVPFSVVGALLGTIILEEEKSK